MRLIWWPARSVTAYLTPPQKIARIREAEYASHPEMFEHEHVPIDFHISPEQLVTRHIKGLIEYAGALQVMDFAQGRAQLVTLKVKKKWSFG